MHNNVLRIATRKSPLALWQAQFVGDQIKQYWPELTIELVPMLTSGDRFLKDKLQAIGGKGLFVKELEEAMLAGRADIAVHSMKDVPAQLPDGLQLAATCRRDNPFDALISIKYDSLESLPVNSVIGTTSLRRQSQLLAYRPDLVIKPLRGNIQTRLAKLESEEFDAIILAAAGLERMALDQHIRQILDDRLMLPACGQGALSIECRSNDAVIQQILQPLNDRVTAACVNAERLVNGLLGGNCHVPLAVYCSPEQEQQIRLRARVLALDGCIVIEDTQNGKLAEANELAQQCADNLLAKGAAELLSNDHGQD
ncbi:hydroxymethylbilane synthase [Legionella dresdenensis]|uniref:Porphobilinogen deaminase n=1 Tax=Legionella dresdenensis TaxID=450200 RepID=A0ABV8CCG7_9GAMM